jgi:mannose/cellobiose epimerase-like protein (N-acyl-D-glucosamine 2-epimerase family)
MGLEPSSGFLADHVDLENPAPLSPGRLWVQTEYLRALLVRAEAGRAHAAPAAARLIGRLFDTYLNHAVPGAFADRLDPQHRPEPSPIMTSTVYHLIGVIAAALPFC